MCLPSGDQRGVRLKRPGVAVSFCRLPSCRSSRQISVRSRSDSGLWTKANQRPSGEGCGSLSRPVGGVSGRGQLPWRSVSSRWVMVSGIPAKSLLALMLPGSRSYDNMIPWLSGSQRGDPAAVVKPLSLRGVPPLAGTSQACSSWLYASHSPSGDHSGGSSNQYGCDPRPKVSRAGQPPSIGIMYRSALSSRSQKKAIRCPSGERLWLRGRSMLASSAWLQPGGGPPSGRSKAGQLLRSRRSPSSGYSGIFLFHSGVHRELRDFNLKNSVFSRCSVVNST